MARFRKKPVIVEAQQFTKESELPCGLFFDSDGNHWTVTIHGQETPVVLGDWIILESKQSLTGPIRAYPCKPDIFEATYEPENP